MRTVFFLIALLSASPAGAADRISVAAFSTGDLDGWTEKTFSGKTEYSIADFQGRRVLRAVSRATASGMYKRVQIDLTKTPYLHWSWEVENTLGPLDETAKAGDDYPARVYVIVSGGIFFWQTRAVNYVWANRQPQGAVWPNAFTDSNRMIAVRSGDRQVGRWIDERRDVRADFRRVFGLDIQSVDAVALMSDTDNSGKAAVAHYGDIYFSAD